MPMYEFACRACGAEFEELCTAAEAAAGKVACPACGARKSERKLSTFASKDAGGKGGGGCGHGSHGGFG
ncbi:MAG: zinc ribbon domain-containing protein [bacterium]|nr:zinc ribbon domain-containing protein [bacterium]MBK9303866.1 zinc ribbon domain-containing protein [bacterium]